MKKIFLAAIALLFSGILKAQFSPEKYFSDSVSFSYKACYTYPATKKEKERTNCGIEKCIVKKNSDRIKIYFVSVYPKSSTNSDLHAYDEVKFEDIDIYDFDIKMYKEYGSSINTPAEFYVLTLRTHSPKSFTTVSLFGKQPSLSAKLYFATSEDANAMKNYLTVMSTVHHGDEVKPTGDPSPKEMDELREITAASFIAKLSSMGYAKLEDIGSKGHAYQNKQGNGFTFEYAIDSDLVKEFVYSTHSQYFLNDLKSYLATPTTIDAEGNEKWENQTHTKKVSFKTTKDKEGYTVWHFLFQHP